MIRRSFWLDKIHKAWETRPIVWLSGVRRTGKTTIARMLEGAEFKNCDLPAVQSELTDPENFYRRFAAGTTLVLDEVHRLADPSQVLKIAADEFPGLRILATGSSTLAATKKFRDSLTGRKHRIHLLPVPWTECVRDFGIADLDRRLQLGGLPEALLAAIKPAEFYSEWLDSFFARDILELFSVRNREGFLKLFRILLRQSGGLLEVQNLAGECGMQRPTIHSHLDALAIAHAVHLVPPWHKGGIREIVKRPKCYAFDTGFVAHERGWDSIRDEDRGILWEHLVLDHLRCALEDESRIHFWRDKSGREIDFVLRRSDREVDALECKIDPNRADTHALKAFRENYPEGRNLVVSPFVGRPYEFTRDGFRLEVVALADLRV